jgi:hypothetical protein
MKIITIANNDPIYHHLKAPAPITKHRQFAPTETLPVRFPTSPSISPFFQFHSAKNLE